MKKKKVILPWSWLFLCGKQKKGQTNMNIEICGKGSLKRILCVIKFNLIERMHFNTVLKV